MEPLSAFFLFLALSTASSFFSGVETALFSLTRIELKRLDQKRPRLGRLVRNLLDHPRRTLTTLLIGNILVNTLSVSFVTLLILSFLGSWALWLMPVYTFFVIVFCEIMPKVLAAKKNEWVAAAGAPILTLCCYLFMPLTWVLHLVTSHLMTSLPEKKDKNPDAVSGEELKTMVKIGEEEGVFDRQERYMIQKLFELGERPVKEIMTPRVDMIALDIEESREEHLDLIQKYHFSHFPVYKDSPDQILGVVPVHSYLLEKEASLETLMRQPLFVPETKRIDELLEELRRANDVFCVCVDEYGGTAGVVTLEDILEEIFGEYYDEYEKAVNPIRLLGHDEYIVDAKISVADFEEFFQVELETEEAATLGGYILEKMAKVPREGEIFEGGGLMIRIQKVVRQRILNVLVRRKPR